MESKVRNLCKNSTLSIVQSAYKEVFIQNENPSDEFIIEEIEWKLNNAIQFVQWGFSFWTDKELADTKSFLEKLKSMINNK